MKKIIKLIIISLLILSSLVPEMLGFSIKFGTDYTYIIKPLIWCFIGIIIFVFFRNESVPYNKYKNEVQFYVLVTCLLYFLIYFMFGYVNGFATNPYDHSLKGVLYNLWTFLPMLIVTEYARYYMINNCPKKHIIISVLLISLVFTAIEINVFKFPIYFENMYTSAKFIMETFLPTLMISLYLSYVCYFAGFEIAIIYSLLPQLALFIFPILPNVSWFLLAILNSAVPFFSYVFINYKINKMDKTLDKRVNKTVGIKGWIVMIASIILIVSFGIGLFPYKPLVIATNSMYPNIRKGDIVIIVEKDLDSIKVGDIIRYQMENYYVVHRVKEIQETESETRQFITKGDNNNTVDLYPVSDYQVKGVIKYKIPYLGYPTLLISKLLNTNVEDTVKVGTGK